MKLCQDLPETESRLRSGKISLSSACQLQVFFEKQNKQAEKKELLSLKDTTRTDQKDEGHSKAGASETSQALPSSGITSGQRLPSKGPSKTKTSHFLSLEQKQNLLKKAEGCSTRATIKLLSEQDPTLSVPKEKIRFLNKGKVEIQIVIDESCYNKLEELKNLLSHKSPSLSYRELLLILSEEALEKHNPRRKRTKKLGVKKTAATSAPKWKCGKAKKLSRTIPSGLKRHIWERDEGQCAYVHSETKRRCSSKHLLQIDHIKPFSLGGKSELSNLRLLCAGHNQFRGEKTFGKKMIL